MALEKETRAEDDDGAESMEAWDDDDDDDDESEDSDEDEDVDDEAEDDNMVVVEDKQKTYRVEWTKQPHPVKDWRTSQEDRWSATLNWNDNKGHDRSALDYFVRLYPMKSVPEMVTATSRNHRPLTPLITKGEIFQVFGFFFAMTLHRIPQTDRSFYWSVDAREDSMLLPPNFGRFGMTHERFEEIVDAFRVGKAVEEDFPLVVVENLVKQFNENTIDALTPGWRLDVVDECLLWRRASEPFNLLEKMKHLECHDTGIVVQLEELRNNSLGNKMPEKDVSPLTTRVVRLSKPYAGRGHVVVARQRDGVASVDTAVSLSNASGLYFVGLVTKKNAKFPLKHLDSVPIETSGHNTHRTLTATVDGVRVLAHAWNKGLNKRKMIVATCGSTLPAKEPRLRKRVRNTLGEAGCDEVYVEKVPQTQLVKDYFSDVIDDEAHSHYRLQFGLALEKAWGAKTPKWVRAFATVLGIIHTNAYLAYVRFHPRGKDVTFAEFTHDVATQLVTNDFDDDIVER